MELRIVDLDKAISFSTTLLSDSKIRARPTFYDNIERGYDISVSFDKNDSYPYYITPASNTYEMMPEYFIEEEAEDVMEVLRIGVKWAVRGLEGKAILSIILGKGQYIDPYLTMHYYFLLNVMKFINNRMPS